MAMGRLMPSNGTGNADYKKGTYIKVDYISYVNNINNDYIL